MFEDAINPKSIAHLADRSPRLSVAKKRAKRRRLSIKRSCVPAKFENHLDFIVIMNKKRDKKYEKVDGTLNGTFWT
jgi:hypothetical protein